MSDHKQFSCQFLIERWADGLKVLGAGNGAGALASGAALQYFADKPEILTLIKTAAAYFFVGIFLLSFAFLILTVLPMALEKFLASSDKTYSGFQELMGDFLKADKKNLIGYMILVLFSAVSVLCFILGCNFATRAIMNF